MTALAHSFTTSPLPTSTVAFLQSSTQKINLFVAKLANIRSDSKINQVQIKVKIGGRRGMKTGEVFISEDSYTTAEAPISTPVHEIMFL